MTLGETPRVDFEVCETVLQDRARALVRELTDAQKPARVTRRSALVVGLAAIAAAAIALPAFGVPGRLVGLFNDPGTPVETARFGREARSMMDSHLGGDWRVRKIGSNGELAFYLVRAGERVCLASGPDREPLVSDQRHVPIQATRYYRRYRRRNGRSTRKSGSLPI